MLYAYSPTQGGFIISGVASIPPPSSATSVEVAGCVMFAVDYRNNANPVVYVIIGDEVVAQKTLITSSALNFFARSEWRANRDWFVRLNVGQDLTNNQFRSDMDAAMAGVGINPKLVVPGWGSANRSDHLEPLPVITISSPGIGNVGESIEIFAQCLDGYGTDQSDHIRWYNLSENWNDPGSFAVGSSYSFEPKTIGYYPLRVEYHDVHGRTITKRIGVMVRGDVLEYGVQQFDELLTHSLVAERLGSSVRFGSLAPAGSVAVINQSLWGDFQYFELTMDQPDNAGLFGFGLCTEISGNTAVDAIGGRDQLNAISDSAGWLSVETQETPSDSAVLTTNGTIDTYQTTGLSFSVDANVQASRILGFAVDYRDKTSAPLVHVIGWDQAGSAPMLIASARLLNVSTPIYPMVYCLAPGNTTAGQADATFNGGSNPFNYDPDIVLSAAGVDTSALKTGWGVDAI